MTREDMDREALRLAEGSAMVEQHLRHSILPRVSGCGLPLADCHACTSALRDVEALVVAVRASALTMRLADAVRLGKPDKQP